MPKSLKIKVGNKAKSHQNSKGKASGKYVRQRVITEKNRRRKRQKYARHHPNDTQTARLL